MAGQKGKNMYYWEAEAKYVDGTYVRRLFAYKEDKSEGDQQYEIECWLIERHEHCIWYSVELVEDDCVRA
jgi:hypothetical protein